MMHSAVICMSVVGTLLIRVYGGQWASLCVHHSAVGGVCGVVVVVASLIVGRECIDCRRL